MAVMGSDSTSFIFSRCSDIRKHVVGPGNVFLRQQRNEDERCLVRRSNCQTGDAQTLEILVRLGCEKIGFMDD
jgi:hypothetical protein